MERLIAKRAVLYQGRQYEPGEVLPAYETIMVDAWQRAGTAEMVSDTKPEGAPTEGNDDQDDQDAQDTNEDTQDDQDTPEMVEGHLDPAQLNSMSKEELVALAKDMDVELPRGATKALIIEKLASVPVHIPEEGSAQE